MIRRRTILLAGLCALVASSAVISAARAATCIFERRTGATREEDLQLAGERKAAGLGDQALLNFLDGVVVEHPTNWIAKLDRACSLMNMGRMDEASREIEEAARLNATSLQLSETVIYYYRIRGDRANELRAMKILSGRTFAEPLTRALANVSIAENRPRIAELSGDEALARREWQALVNRDPPRIRAYDMTEQAQFFLRQRDWSSAVETAKAAAELELRQARPDPETVASARMWHGLSLWASGKREEALGKLLESAKKRCEQVSSFGYDGDPARRNVAVFGARALAARGSEQEKSTVAALLSEMKPTNNLYSLQSAVQATNNESDRKAVSDRIVRVLTQAPQLDWALWAALYEGLSNPRQRKQLFAMLPSGCVQKLIAEQEEKAAAIKTSSGSSSRSSLGHSGS